MRGALWVSAAAVLVSMTLSGCNSVDKPVADPYLPDAITSSLGSTVEYNKLCQSEVGQAPAGCQRKKHPNMDADLAAAAVSGLKAGPAAAPAK